MIRRILDDLLGEDDRLAPVGWAGVLFAIGYVLAHVVVWYWKGGPTG